MMGRVRAHLPIFSGGQPTSLICEKSLIHCLAAKEFTEWQLQQTFRPDRDRNPSKEVNLGFSPDPEKGGARGATPEIHHATF